MDGEKSVLRTPKSIALLRLLDQSEFISFKEKLVHKKKIRLLIISDVLWEIREANFTEEIKAALFLQIFSESYTEDKDYLLRNEFRHLNDQLEDFLVTNEINKEVESNKNAYNYYLLRALQDRKSLDLFKKEYQDSYDHAIINADYYAAHNIAGLNFVNYTQFLNIKEKDLKYINVLNDLKLTHLSCYYLTAFRNHQINAQLTHNLFFPFSIIETEPFKKVEVNFENYENDYSGYLYLKAKSYLVTHEKRIPILLECLTFLRLQPEESTIFKNEIRFCLSHLAKSYSLIGEFEKAGKYFQDYFELEMDKDDVERLSVLCDYLIKLIKLKEYEKAINIIETNRTEFSQVDKLKIRILGLEIASYAFTGNFQCLFNILPNSFTGYNRQHKNFMRLYYSIHSYLTNNFDDASREIKNLNNSNRKIDLSFDISSILNFFTRFYYIIVKYNPEEKKKIHYLEKLLKDVALYTKESLPEYGSYLPLLWLHKELDNIVCSYSLNK